MPEVEFTSIRDDRLLSELLNTDEPTTEGKALLGTVRTHYITEVAAGVTVTFSDLATWGIDTSKNKWWRVKDTDFTISWTSPHATIAGMAANTDIDNIQLRIDCDTGEFEENFDYPTTTLP